MDSSQKGYNTIDLGSLSMGDITLEPLTITSSSVDTISISNTTAGAVGAGYTISGIGTSPTWTTGTNGIDWSVGANIRQSGTIELNGTDADIVINGRSLMDAISALEQRLNILVPNPELEAEWDQLRELGERYRELERQCKEKGDMWKKLKSMPPPEIK